MRNVDYLVDRFCTEYTTDSKGRIDFKAVMIAIFHTSPLDGGRKYLAFKMCDLNQHATLSSYNAYEVAKVSH